MVRKNGQGAKREKVIPQGEETVKRCTQAIMEIYKEQSETGKPLKKD
jgi:hypothetical protein